MIKCFVILLSSYISSPCLRFNSATCVCYANRQSLKGQEKKALISY